MKTAMPANAIRAFHPRLISLFRAKKFTISNAPKITPKMRLCHCQKTAFRNGSTNSHQCCSVNRGGIGVGIGIGAKAISAPQEKYRKPSQSGFMI